MEARVPIIDLNPFRSGGAEDRQAVARAVDEACREIGFLVIVGHGVPQTTIDRAHAASRALFDLDVATKERYGPPPGGYLGYRGVGSESLSYSLDQLTPTDLKEAFTIRRVDTKDEPYFTCAQGQMFFQPNIWPAEVPELREAWSALYRALDQVSTDLMRVFAAALDLPVHFFDDKIDKNISCLRALNYPDQRTRPLAGQLRAGAHTDYGSLSLLSMEDAPGGLQVHRGGDVWDDIHAPSGSFVLNIGDLMAQWTNDAWISTLHRVSNPPEDTTGSTRRQSLVFFHQPNYDAEIVPLESCCKPDRPPRYERTTSGNHLFMKMTKAKTVNAEQA
jgi:isopenicillin N synthase-like dioxygenase